MSQIGRNGVWIDSVFVVGLFLSLTVFHILPIATAAALVGLIGLALFGLIVYRRRCRRS